MAPEPADQLDPGWAEKNAIEYNASTFTYEEVRDRFAPFPNIRVIKGRVPEILGQAYWNETLYLGVLELTRLYGMPSPTASKSGCRCALTPMASIIAPELEATDRPVMSWFHTFDDGNT